MKMVKSLLLGSVAGVAAISGAQAADLPLAEPVEYVRICDTWGAGYFYIPGTQTCLQISGLVRSNLYYTEQFTRGADSVFFRNRARLNFDARTQTEMGTLRSYIRLQGDWSNNSSQNSTPFGGSTAGNVTGIYAEKAFIQFAGFTAGLSQSFFDSTYSGSYVHLFTSDVTTNVIGYTATFGSGFSATLAVEDRSGREAGIGANIATIGLPAYAGTTMPDVVANIAVNQAWGSFQLSGAVHQIRDNTIIDFDPGVGVNAGWNGADTEYGFAVQASGAVNLPFMAKGTRLFLTGTYTDGALGYLGSVGAPLGGLGLGLTEAYVGPAGNLETSTAWSLVGGGSFFFTPTLRSHITVGYVDVDSAAALVGGVALTDYSQVQAAANIVYSPVANLDLGLEVFYTSIVDDNFVAPIAATASDERFGAIARVERRF